MQKAASAYFQTQVTTTSQGDIVVMLYDGAIKFLNQAKEYLAANDMAQKGIAISRCMDILNELDSALNIEKGGELAQNLHSLYSFCTNHLLMANLKKSSQMIDEVLRVLNGLREAYAAILSTPEAQAASEQARTNLKNTSGVPARPQAGNAQAPQTPNAPAAAARMRAMYSKAAPQAEQAPVPELPEQDIRPEAHQEQIHGAAEMPPAGTLGRRHMSAEAYRKLSSQF